MSLSVSADVEARILAKARKAGVSVDDYLDQVIGESEAFLSIVQEVESKDTGLSKEEVRAKIDRGLSQLERGDSVDGEQFMRDLLAEVDDESNRRIG